MSKAHPLIQFIFLSGLLLYAALSPAADDPFAELSLRAGFYTQSFPDFSVEDIEVSIKLLSEELGKDAGISTQIIAYQDVDTMRQDFERGKINFVVASSLILATQFDTQQFADGFRFIRNGDATDRLLVLVQKKSGKTHLKDFRGKRLALAQHDPMSELYMDFLAWTTFKQGYKASFKEIPRARKAHQLILKLFFDQADITSVYQTTYESAVELNPQLLGQLHILAQIDGIPQGGGLFHKNTPTEFRERIIQLAFDLNANPHGQQLLQLFKGDHAVRSSVADLLPAKKLYDAHQRLVSGK